MNEIDRRRFLRRSGVLAASTAWPGTRLASAQITGPAQIELDPNPSLFAAPNDPKLWDAYRDALAKWRDETKHRLQYDDSLYRRDDFAWVPSTYSCCFVVMGDETFYDPKQGRYTVDAFLDQAEREFGGYDAVVLWHAYPRIGFDDRNQFDFYRDMPGGLAGVKALVCELHASGVKVFVDYNPWDVGTRREGVSDLDALAALLEATGADGIFLDTMHQAAAEFRQKLDRLRPGLVLESELALPVESIADHHLSWAQWFNDSHVPGVLRNKWLERRHMQHQIKRWSTDHTSELHMAWMNGSGMMVWENVFGNLVSWNARDRSILRSMLPIQRRYVKLFSGEGWTPLVPTEQPEVYASLWEGEGLRLWTLVNRSDQRVEGTLLRVPRAGPPRGCFDLIQGVEIPGTLRDGRLELRGSIGPRGIGGFVSGTDAALGRDFPAFLQAQKELHARADFNTEFPQRETVLAPPAPTNRYSMDGLPEGMVAIPAQDLRMKVTFRSRECGFYNSHDDVRPGFHKPRVLERDVRLTPYAIDLVPVTNARYGEFLNASGYQPRHAENFLKHWRAGRPPEGKEDHPAVYIDLDDARAYARWAGKRLPTEEEWQFAAGGPEALEYPWGNGMEPGRANGGERGGTTGVAAFPDGRSPFGCYDMCGNTWEWTESQRSDGRTRFAILKGGSHYQAEGSHWYADGGPRPSSFAAKFLLTWPGLDRCATIGFRCVVDLG
ncbi:MAG TPA: SUMF1/EgtB/PvdO family nonheme iron enzyme [Thermoguttaceae bacterium]|nr:SUMF1/EgtB/PvdO family nonheme iron enzyme [Thermoguttaceae bacterium]